MISIDDVDLDTYCGRVGNLYVRHGLCPPFALRRIASDWKVSGIALSHIVAVIDRHLTDHRNRYYSGSGDALFTWLDEFIRNTWYERQVSPPQAKPNRPTTQRTADHEGIDPQNPSDASGQNHRSARGTSDRAPTRIATPFPPTRAQPQPT